MTVVFPAATLLLVRDGSRGLEVLLLKRSSQLSFGAGAWVFPGGRIDKADYLNEHSNVEAAARRAAVRETMEEAGIDIEQENLECFAHWLTPEGHPKRFATWFYVAKVNDSVDDVVIDDGEIVDYQWCSPEFALDTQLPLMYPTKVTLSELARYNGADQAISNVRQRPKLYGLPKIVRTEDSVVILYPKDQGYEHAQAEREGSRDRIWVADHQWQYEKSH